MGYGDNFMIKPGTLFLFVLIAALGLAMFSWASSNFESAEKKSPDDQKDAVKCSTLDISVEELKTSNNSVKVFFSSSKDVDKIFVNFEGASNVTKSVSDIRSNSIRSVEAELKDFSSVRFNVPGCNAAFDGR